MDLMVDRQSRQIIISSIVSRIPLSIFDRLTRTTLIIPYYHMVSDETILHLKHLYKFKTIREFKNDLEFLLKNYSPISLQEVMHFIKTGLPFPKKVILMTFDDGFREMYDVVAPILLEKGVRATFFVNSAFIDNKTMCYQHKASILIDHVHRINSQSMNLKIKDLLSKNGIRFNDIKSSILSIPYQKRGIVDELGQIAEIYFEYYLQRNKPYLTSDQISTLIRKGFTIGAHSIDHPVYSSLSLKDQLHQTRESVNLIKEKFGLNYGAFAFPHHDHSVSKEFFVEIYKDGLIDISFGTSGIRHDVFARNIQRFSLENPAIPAAKILPYQLVRAVYKKMIDGNKIIRR